MSEDALKVLHRLLPPAPVLGCGALQSLELLAHGLQALLRVRALLGPGSLLELNVRGDGGEAVGETLEGGLCAIHEHRPQLGHAALAKGGSGLELRELGA